MDVREKIHLKKSNRENGMSQVYGHISELIQTILDNGDTTL